MFRQTLEKLLGNTHRLIDVIDGVLTAFLVSQNRFLRLPEKDLFLAKKRLSIIDLTISLKDFRLIFALLSMLEDEPTSFVDHDE